MNEKNPVIRTSRRLPTGRAVLGGLLITLAVLGVLIGSRLGDDATFQEVVVASTDLAPGTILGPEHVTRARVRLDESVDFVITEPEDVYGSVLIGPLERLEFVQRANVTNSVASGFAEVSLAIEPERAPARLSPGELVSILGTFDDGDDKVTRLIADRVVVLSYQTDGSDFSNEAVLRLGLDDGAVAAQIVNASRRGELSIVGISSAPDIVLPNETR